MVAFYVETQLVVPVAAASCHALSDFARPAHVVLPSYALAFAATQPEWTVTPLFALASVLHFSSDTKGVPRSAAMHLAWATTACVFGVEAGFALFSLFYCARHAPAHVASLPSWRAKLAILLAAAAMATHPEAVQGVVDAMQRGAGVEAGHGPGFVLTDAEQRVVVGHAVCDAISRVRGRRGESQQS